MKKWNHYHCPKCGGITIARHDDEGVTPFMLRCRAKDTFGVGGVRAHGCEEMAESSFFSGPQDDDQIPHVIFYRPESMKAIEAINKEPKRDRAWWLEHYKQGGSLMREAT
jgi:hypothetical protein